MVDDELAEIRRRRMAELQRQQMERGAMEEELQKQKQAEAQIHLALMQILEPEARERLNTIKLTKPEFAKAVEQQLVMLSQSGRINGRISDEQLKAILRQLIPEKREYNITRR
ncbi:programmed cell death protein 5 [Methanomicrobium sp. W14]|uniref:DNA-binding protein n=1 Tax=Methanomicrobium sp. W14 TaxID=2817839 RepID=UPI001AE925E5|nr:DNA-binding protein [Methanomicrobium sp. W14]MBP2132859.1 programmed cell death protein 5 [Methanomicrobium sp. W14]